MTRDPNIKKILKDRYLLNGESEDDMYQRVALALGGYGPDELISDDGEAYYKMMSDGLFLPNTPTLRNAGTSRGGGYSACYVVPIEDSLDGIYRALHHSAIIHKAFGGTGFYFGSLRPAGAHISSTGGRACGPTEVLKLFNQSAGVIRQGGIRDGANMAVINITHPDVKQFITVKRYEKINHFNISVSVTDQNMHDLKQCDYNDSVWKLICETAHATGCPGILFIDRINATRWCDEPIQATNPCGEQPLPPYGSCNLGSINLAAHYDHTNGTFDTEKFIQTIHFAVRMLDAVIDNNMYPLPEIEQVTKRYRPIGLGVMGWADLLIKMGIRWSSSDALHLIDNLGRTLHEASRRASHDLYDKYGPYPGAPEGCQLRNACLTTVAPTGTLRMLAGCNEGIEPVYGWDLTRTDESGTRSYKHHRYDEAAANDLLADTALLITPEWHIKHQAQWQKWIDNAVSKTVNLPHNCTPVDVERIYEYAFMSKCKGVTIYRTGSKADQVMTSGVNPKFRPTGTVEASANLELRRSSVERFGSTIDLPSGCGKIYVTTNSINRDSPVPYEVYVLTSGGCPALNEALGKCISKYVHDNRLAGGEIETIKRITGTLAKVKCPTAIKNTKACGPSCPAIIANRMAEVFLTGHRTDKNSVRVDVSSTRTCPDCGAELEFGSGCNNGTCSNCGWSGCS